ncbi:MAG: peptidase M48 [Gemmatimonadales bacterium]|nr:MAG: peptidase M48 [Gemmatimonadales bacterium]
MVRFVLWLVLILMPAPLLTGCAVNPVTGQRQFVLFTESQEIELGREADRDIVAQLGIYDDPELAAWLDDMGQRMAAGSERPHLPWTFRILDDPTINAFALPGGYIYMTRGILTHLNSDAEVAGIVGHEIGHVTARHGVVRVSRAQIAQLGLGLGMILAPDLQPFGEVAGAGLQLLFLRNSRDAEREADDLGLRYMTELDYDPRAVARVFEMLGRASGAEDGDRIPGFLSTHPDPGERRGTILERTTGDDPELTGSRDDRDGYLQRLQGMTFGEDPRQGYFRQSVFYHPELAFRLDFPSGWRTANTRSEVQGVSPEQDAVLLLGFVDEASPRAARDQFMRGEGMTEVSRSDAAIDGLDAATADFRISQDGQDFRGRVLFIRHGDATYRVLGYARQAAWGARGEAINRAVVSFRRVTDPAILGVQPRRIELVRTDTEMTFEGFVQRYPSTVPADVVGVVNGLRPGQVIPAGTLLKRVVGEGTPR